MPYTADIEDNARTMTIPHWVAAVIPPQHTGASSTTKSSHDCRTKEEAGRLYKLASARLLDVNHWQDFAGKATAQFQLLDASGKAVSRTAEKGDYFRIDIPAPGNPDSGADWVQVQETGSRAKDADRLVWMTVRAALDPRRTPDASAHFLAPAATSTFVVYQWQRTITAAVFGRNEHANLKSDRWLTRVRNWLVYLGAQLGLAKLQWKSLTKGLLKQG